MPASPCGFRPRAHHTPRSTASILKSSPPRPQGGRAPPENRSLARIAKMKIDPDEFRVRPGEKLKLKKWPTRVKPYYASDEQYRKRLAEHVERLSSLHTLLYAPNRHALLAILHASDAPATHGLITHV